MSARIFFLTLVTALALLTVINVANVPVDAFAPTQRAARSLLADLPAIDTSRLKLRHADRVDRFSVGTFGNSRVLMLDGQSLGVRDGAFFNFGIGGQSFRQSTRMLQSLAAAQRAPDIAIVSFDYTELGLPGGSPITPGPLGRIADRTADIAYMFANGFPLRAIAVFIWNNTIDELRRIEAGFTYKVVRTRAQILAAGFWQPRGGVDYFRLDGSSIQILPATQQDISWPIRHRRSERYPLLERDLETLSAIASAGTRVVIYESPIAPTIRAGVESSLSENARDVRDRLFAGCAARALECYATPMLDGRTQGVYWPDATHAPAPLLSAWLRERIADDPVIAPETARSRAEIQ